MSLLNQDQLVKFNRAGLIPGPGEDLEQFSQRASYCLNLKHELNNEVKELLNGDGNEDSQVLEKPLSTLENFYDCRPSWIPLFFSNYKLMPWNGGCAWIFQQSESSPTAALIQLRKQFKHKEYWLGFYSRDELLTHELVHVGRMAFNEPKFEEFLAYRTSQSRFRRYFGPIIETPSESVLFILCLFLLIVFDVFLIGLGRTDAYRYALWLKLIPLGLVFLALIRLWKKHQTVKNCVSNLQGWLGNEIRVEAILYRLTDSEIMLFSQSTSDEIKDYAEIMTQKEPRWQVISFGLL